MFKRLNLMRASLFDFVKGVTFNMMCCSNTETLKRVNNLLRCLPQHVNDASIIKIYELLRTSRCLPGDIDVIIFCVASTCASHYEEGYELGVRGNNKKHALI